MWVQIMCSMWLWCGELIAVLCFLAVPLTEANVPRLCNLLESVDWVDLRHSLMIPPSMLIFNLESMLHEWIKHYSPSWDKLTQALAAIGHRRLAEDIISGK